MKVKEAIDTIPEADWDALEEAVESVVPGRPPNSFTIAEAAKRKGMGETATRMRFRALIEAGKMKMIRSGPKVYYQLVRK